MRILYKLTVYENNIEILTSTGGKTSIIKMVSDIMSNINKDIRITIETNQK